MRSIIKIIAFMCLAGHSYADSNTAIMNDPDARIQYSMGYHIGTVEELKEMQIDQDALFTGIMDTLSGELQLSENEMRLLFLNLGQNIVASKNTKKEMQRAYQEKNQSFLIENQTRPGVVTTDSGLQYEILQPGEGQTPGLNDQVDVRYTGSLINGHIFEKFDSNDVPATFKVSQIIKGWAEALQLMKQGAKWRLYIPAELAYGSQGVDHFIPPDSTLILDVDLLSVN